MNNTTNTTGSPEEQTMDQAQKMFKIVFYIVLFIVGTVGNILVVIIIRNKRRRTVNDCFILNLAISDLTFLWFALPFYFYELFERFVKYHFYCKFVWPMMSVSLFVGIFTLTFMSVERCRAILFPFRPRIKKTTLFLAIICIWTASILCIIPLMIVVLPEGLMCLEHWPSESHRKAYTAALFILQFAVPISVIAVAYITIIVKLIKTKVPNRTSVNQRGQLVKQKKRTENIHVIRTVAIIVVLFVACMLPNQIAWILMDFGGEQHKNLSEKFWLFAEALMFLHSCVNPIIYGTLTRQFREGYIKYINFVCCCGRSAQKSIDLSEHRHYQDRQSNTSRPQERLTYKGSLRSPSIIKSTASTQAATGMSFLTFRSSSPKTSPSPSLIQLSPVLNNNKHSLQTNTVELHGNSFPTSVPVQYHVSPGVASYKDGTTLINQGVLITTDNLQHFTDCATKLNAVYETEDGFNFESNCRNGMFGTQTNQEQFKPVQEDNDKTNKAIEQHLLRGKTNCLTLQNGFVVPDNHINYNECNHTDYSAGRCLVAGPSVNYGVMNDEECSLQDTHL
ncbi:neuropeptide receptor 22-like [Actinia tenebrosa]|uniref:Neuropeptide receptor 22-like n=1 Tax=Actinia tenebrosa TaxID=6105 RepID=A0A6P8H8W0_ACTTE|nr:neuropeptide receptor 22-like [Actinia tenebrosa]